MKFIARPKNFGIELSLFLGPGPKSLKPAPDVDQENPRRSYVYAHVDSRGKIFYVRKGEGTRAWSPDRHPLWKRFVEKHLEGKYRVLILHDNLSPTQADEVEAEWIAQCAADLVNWVNMGRATDYKALDEFHRLRKANLAFIQQAKATEKKDLEAAVGMYRSAIEKIREYALIDYEKGLVGQLLREEAEEIGRRGDVVVLDRLTLCLIKLGRADEAAQHARDYFDLYKRDLGLAAAQRIQKRIEKALLRPNR